MILEGGTSSGLGRPQGPCDAAMGSEVRVEVSMRRIRSHLPWVFLAVSGLAAVPAALAGEAPRLSLPIACEPQKSCFIQNLVDVDASSGVQDYRCGSASYDGHKGTDFRVLSVAAAKTGVPVLSAAEGTVLGVRDGTEDGIVTPGTRAAVAGRECGNGLVIDHGNGWHTQYCHMRKGSLKVRSGDRVGRGDLLGFVGFSGLAQFAHVHFEVRKDGIPVDPFTGRSQAEACNADAAEVPGLWDETAARAFPYPDAVVLGVGFAADPAAVEGLETDDRPPEPARTSGLILYYMRAANLRTGDRVSFRLEGPAGVLAETTLEPFDRPKAAIRPFIGKKRTGAEWPAGTYRGSAKILRGGNVIAERQTRLELK